jgi:hypothetical protein
MKNASWPCVEQHISTTTTMATNKHAEYTEHTALLMTPPFTVTHVQDRHTALKSIAYMIGGSLAFALGIIILSHCFNTPA